MHVANLDLREVVIFLAAAGIIVPIASRARVSPIVGFIIVGILIGPHGLARWDADLPWLAYIVIPDAEGIRPFAEMGVVFLLFMIGLEVSAERLWALRRLVFGLGSLQVAITSAAIAGVAYLAGNGPSASFLVGASLSLSSTAIVLQLLSTANRTNSEVGQVSLAVLLLQDLAVVPILFMLGVLGPSPQEIGTALGLSLLQAAAAIALILGIGRLIVRPLFRLVGSTRSREMFMAATLLAIIAASAATAAAGLSLALGAFLAGLLFAGSEYRREIEVDVEPFKGLLLGVFFLSVGMGIDPARIAAQAGWILAALAGLFAIKAAITAVLARAFGSSASTAAEAGLLLGQAGEFVFVIGGLATSSGILSAEAGQFLLILTSLSMMATPLVARLAERISAAIEGRPLSLEEPGAAEDSGRLSGHVIVVGYGRVGKLVSQMLTMHGVAYLAVDSDPYLVGRERRTSRNVHFGDATHPDFLRRCGVAKAKALIATMDSPRAVELVVAAARRERSEMTIVARARDPEHARELYQLGATDAVPETIEASLQLSEALLVDIGIPMGLVIASIHEKRDEFRRILQGGASPGRHSVRAPAPKMGPDT